MYEVWDEEEGGKWFLLIITLSLQMPLEKKKIHPMQGTVAILRPFRISVSYYPEIANHCFLSYIFKKKKNKKKLSTS